MQIVKRPKFIMYCATVILGLFYSPLTAQHISENEPMQLEFGIGLKTTLPIDGLLNDMTHANISRGVFVESRLGLSGGWLRVRATMDDWGQNIYSKDHQYITEIRCIRGTVGIMYYLNSNAVTSLYWCVEAGVNHWDINSTHPLFGKGKYNRFAAGTNLGMQTKHLFLEFIIELTSMDNKGIKRKNDAGRVIAPPPAEPIPRDYPSILELSLSLAAGYKF